MFKKKIIHVLIISLLLTQTLQLSIEVSTYCLANCYFCPITPQQCQFIQSIPFPNVNHNCLPYSFGTNCNISTDGFQFVPQLQLSGWDGGQTNPLINQNCTLYQQPPTVPHFNSLGPINSGVTLTKNITINRDKIDAIILKMGFTLNSDNLFDTISNTTTSNFLINSVPSLSNQTFANVSITGNVLNFNFLINYPSTPSDMSTIVNSTCGINVQYVYQYTLPQSISSLGNYTYLITIASLSVPNTTWGITKFQVQVGCGGFIIPKDGLQCGGCASGYFPILATQDLLLGCGLCPPTCLACNSDGCTLCQPYTQLNLQTSQCDYLSTYINISNPKILQGISIPDKPNSKYLYNIISPNNSKIISLQTTLQSPAPFSIMFIILYSNYFILNNNQSINVNFGNYNLLTIPASEFRAEVGTYDLRLENSTVKYFAKNIYIDEMSIPNLQKVITINITSPLTQGFYISNYQIIQYQCTPRCSSCDQTTNSCLQCNSFFINNGSIPCSICSNGFFRKISWDNSISNTTVSITQPDMCVKCYSTCMQCVGQQINKCIQCYNMFQLDTLSFDTQCITCIFNAQNHPELPPPKQCQRCLNTFSTSTIFAGLQCNTCVRNATINDIFKGTVCTSCWVKNGLAYSRCIPIPQSGLTFYGSDISNGAIDSSGWSGSGSYLQKTSCTNNYIDIWGINNTSPQSNLTITWSTKNLPPHSGLYIIFNIFKIDITPPDPITNKSQNIYVDVSSGTISKTQINNPKNGQSIPPGTNLCKGDGNQMIYTFTYNLPKHTSQNYQVMVTSEGGGIYLRQLQLYLSNCNSCDKYQLNYQIGWLPRYSFNSTTSSGLDLYIQFNQPVEFSNSTDLKKAFTFNIDKLPNLKMDALDFYDQLLLNQRLHYYIPIDMSFINGSLTVTATPNANIFGVAHGPVQLSRRRLLLHSPLNILQSNEIISRYSTLNSDDEVSTVQIYQFYHFFQWFTLITMIVCIFLGIGVVFEQFSIMLQLLFLHVYISSALLPATFKAPIIGLSRMQHLNYFADAHSKQIEQQWFSNYQHPSPFIFQQYNKDILFQRSFYPIIIINIMYLIWFLILFITYKAAPVFQTSKSTIVGFFRNIPARPLNFADQIWRYQFITTIWASFMQFHLLKNANPRQQLNLALCFISFIISIIWPFFVILFTYKMNVFKYSSQFMYKYEDIYFMKIQTISQNKIKYYLYVFLRFFRYLLIVLFINAFTDYQIVAPIILIFINLIQIIYVVSLRIFYNSVLGAVFKIAENLLFIGIQVSLLFVYGFSDNATDPTFLNLGYALNVLYVITILVGLLRVGYYTFYKFKDMKYNMMYGIDNGQIVEVGPTPLPNTEREEREDVETNQQL